MKDDRNTKQANACSERVTLATSALGPSRETMRKLARQPEVVQVGLNMVDKKTGEIVDYDRLTPYMEKAGYLPALAFKLGF